MSKEKLRSIMNSLKIFLDFIFVMDKWSIDDWEWGDGENEVGGEMRAHMMLERDWMKIEGDLIHSIMMFEEEEKERRFDWIFKDSIYFLF